MVLTEVLKKKVEDKFELAPAITAEWCKADAECKEFHTKHWKYYYGEKDCANLKSDASISLFNIQRKKGSIPIVDWE